MAAVSRRPGQLLRRKRESMSQDKIEIECAFCQSLLRVDISHAGKRLRCPSCNNISDIPGDRAERETTPKPAPTMLEPAFDDRPKPASPIGDDTGASTGPTLQIGPRRNGDVIGLATGIGGIFGNFICPCASPIILLACGWGLYRAYRSDGAMRSAAITTNIVAMVIAFVRAGFFWMFSF